MKRIFSGGFLAALLVAMSASAALAEQAPLDQACVMRLAATAEAAMTLAELRRECAAQGEPAGDAGLATSTTVETGAGQRPAVQYREGVRPFSILTHRPNYFLVAAYNAEGWDPSLFWSQLGSNDFEFDNVESQFQISLKVPLATNMFGRRIDLYGAYTNRSFWQMYNSENSKPFRETNHEPEVWVQFRTDGEFWGLKNTLNKVGLNHQSNGRAGVLSRSWDRIFASFLFERGNWAFSLKPWVWIVHDKENSDNPDIDEFMGHGEFRAFYGRNRHVFSAMLRNQLESGFDRGAVEMSWSFPILNYPYLRGYVQYFYGYGESLIDYDRKVNRIGIGISVTDWLD